MEPSGRRCHSAWVLRIHRLIARRVALTCGVRNIRGKRHFTQLVQHFKHWALKDQLEELSFAADNSRFFVQVTRLKNNRCAFFGGLARAKHRNRFMLTRDAFNQRFDVTTTWLMPKKTRFNDARIVSNKQVARAQKVHDIGEDTVFNDIVINMQKAGRRAIRERILSDQFLRELEIKIGK